MNNNGDVFNNNNRFSTHLVAIEVASNQDTEINRVVSGGREFKILDSKEKKKNSDLIDAYKSMLEDKKMPTEKRAEIKMKLLKTKQENLESAYQKEKNSNKELVGQLNDLKEKINDLKEQIEKLKCDEAVSVITLEDSRFQISCLKGINTKLTEENNDLINRINSTGAELLKLNKQMQVENENAQEKLAKIEVKLIESQQKISELEAQKKEVSATLFEMTDSWVVAVNEKDQFEEMTQKQAKTIDLLNLEKSAQAKEIADLKAQLEQAKANNKRQREDSEKKIADKDELITQKDAKIRKMSTNVDVLKSQFSEFLKQVNR